MTFKHNNNKDCLEFWALESICHHPIYQSLAKSSASHIDSSCTTPQNTGASTSYSMIPLERRIKSDVSGARSRQAEDFWSCLVGSFSSDVGA